MNLQSITGIYPSNIGSYTQSITGVYNTGGGKEYINTDNNIVIDNVSNIINLSTNIITSLTDLSNNKQDNITLVAGNNISISNLNSSWTIEAIASGAEYSNPDNNLVINNVNDTINLSTNINVSKLNTSTLIIPNNTITKNKITNLNTSLNSLSNSIGSLNSNVSNLSSNIVSINSNVSNLSNNKQDNITLVAGNNISISNLNSSWTIEAIASGAEYSNPDNNLVINNVNDTINLSTSIIVSNLNTSSLTIPDNSITKNKITNLNTSLDSLSNSIGSLNTNVSNLSGDIVSINTNVSNLSGDIGTLNTNVSNLSSNIVSINTNVSNLSSDIVSINSNVSNLSSDIVSINTNVSNLSSDIGTINTNVSNLSSDIVSINTNVSNLSGDIVSINSNVSNLSGDIGTLNTSVSNLSGDITTLNTSVSNLSGDITTLNTSVSNLSSDIVSINTNVSNLSGDIVSINTNVSNLSSDIVSINSNVSNLSGDIVSINTNVSNLSSDIVSINTNVSNLSSDIVSINSNVSNLSSDIVSINSNVSNMSSNIANLNTSVSDLGNIETIARAWAQSSSPPDPNNASSKSSKTWASRSEEWAQSDGLPGGVGTLSSMGWALASGGSAGFASADALLAFGYAGSAGTSETNAGSSASDANDFKNDAETFKDKAKEWAQSNLSPDDNDADAKSSKTWSNESKKWAQSTSEPGGQDTKSSKSWAGKSESWAQSTGNPGGGTTKSSKSWSNVAKDWAEKTTSPAGGSTKSSKSWSNIAYDWAESTDQPGVAGTKSSRSWADIAKDWAEKTTAPGGGSTRSAKTIVNDFNNSLSTNLTVNHVRIGEFPAGSDNQATFMNKLQINPNLPDSEQWEKYCLMQNATGYTFLNSPLKVSIRIKNVDVIEIINNKVTVRVPLVVGVGDNAINVGPTLTNHGTTLGNHGTAISNIQGDISDLNTDISDLDNNKQNNITINGGTNVSVSKNSNTWTINSANITLVGGTNVSVSKNNNTWTINSSDSNLLGTNNISVFNNSINLTSNISTDNCSLINLSADEITSGLARITGTLFASFGNIDRPNEPAITQSSGGVVKINSYQNYIYLNKHIADGTVKSLYFTGTELVMSPVKIGGINGDAIFSNINHYNILDFALAQSDDGQTWLSSGTSSIKTLKGMDISGNINASTINTSSLIIPNESIPQNKITNLTANISSVNSALTNLSNNKQNNITLVAGANITIAEDPADTFTIGSTGSNSLSGTNNISVRNGSINLSSNISTNNCSLLNLSVNNLLNVNTLKMGTIVSGIIGQDNIACIAQQNYFNNTGYALGQTTGGQTLINSNTSVIKAIKNMEIVGNLKVANNINASTFASIDGTITNINTTEIVSFTTNARNANISNIESLIINASNINASNISIKRAFVEIELNTADINVSNINSSIITTGDINVDDISVIENGRFRMKAGSNYGELKAYSTKFNISCSNALYLSLAHHNKERINIYSNKIDLNVNTNISGILNVSEISTSSVSSNSVSSNSISTSNMSATNMSVSNDLTVGGVLTAPNINLTGLNTLAIGNALMGYLQGDTAYAVFCHKDNNSASSYALIQSNTNNHTFLNCRDGGTLFFRISNNDRMNLYTRNNYTCVDLIHPSSSGNTRLRFYKGNGDNWAILNLPTSNYLVFRWNGEDKFKINSNGDTVSTRNDYSNYTATGLNPQYGNTYGMWSHRNWNNDSLRYMALQEQGGDTYLNGYNRLSLRIRNIDKLYVDNNGAYLSDGTAISSDDRLKFEEQDISGLSIIRQLNPKKYIKIDLPYVKKRRRYYDEYEVSIIDDYIYDICQNEVDKINQERRDISLNDLSSNDYYRDEDYIHKDKITEEDVNAFVSQEVISNGHVECGLIAQEVLETDISWVVHQQYIPEDIQKPLFQPLSVRYDDIYPYCIQAIKELDVIVQGLRDKINNLESENDILLGRLEAGGL